jgi:predicted acylesterase/phospholipase RssA
MTDKNPGQIITFYSYKGGTGRSMALANVAWILAYTGNNVLCIDWDLEAPGLHRYFYPFFIDKELTESDGIIDFVNNYTLEAVSSSHNGDSDPDWYKPHANILRYAVSLDYGFDKGRLDFVPAGRQGPGYDTRVNSFDWWKFYERLGGGLFLEEAKRQMKEEYDYILIDSRTGFSDTSGICTIQMPDILVSCFTLNNQGIQGAARVTKSVFERRKGSGLKVFPVPMRLDIAEGDKLRKRRQLAKDTFFPFPNHLVGGDHDQYWDDVAVAYIPYYAYEEVLAMFVEGRTPASILTSAEKLCKYLTHNPAPQLISSDKLPTLEESERVLAEYAGQPLLLDLKAELNAVAENALARLSPDELLVARRLIERLIKLGAPEQTDGHMRQRLQLDDLPLTDRRIAHELRSSRLLRIDQDTATAREQVQIADEDFLHAWKRLGQWINEDRAFLVWLTKLKDSLQLWKEANASRSHGSAVLDPNEYLLKGDDLLEAQKWLNDRYADIYPEERSFIERSGPRHATRTGESLVEPVTLNSVIPPRDSKNVKDALVILRGGKEEPRRMLELATRLKGELRFSYARRLLLRASRHKDTALDKQLREKVFQQLALCTYKDEDLPADDRLDRALEILREIADFGTTRDQETLGLIGAIHKRKWEIDNQREHLERSLVYYLRGYELGPRNDQGYTGINAAYILDRLASLEEAQARKSGRYVVDTTNRNYANLIRENIINEVGALINDPNYKWLNDKWWYYATIAEAYFGLQQYDEAVKWIQTGLEAVPQVYEWELETCSRQLASIAYLQELNDVERAWDALKRAFGVAAIPRSAFTGKVGLALSGGGFRASLYHLGVLAQLAELDMLRKVEVLSCVSGGSIAGAHYYLKVRQLLQSKTDAEITREDYIQLVSEMIDELVAGVQMNIRTRVAVNPLKNFRIFRSSMYSRTTRAGELYEQHLYSRVKDDHKTGERWLNELTISPRTNSNGEVFNDISFAPKYQNWRRDAKVPILVLNAATLNTGHTWQFTATWMGEAPAGIDSEIDGNDRLRRMYYREAPEQHQKVRLGQAVGASAAVPGVFEPLTMDDLYPDRIIRLADGGVADNQGVATLLEQDCKIVLVSDASGQMESQPAASRGILGVLLRTNSIFQARIREAEYHDLKGRRRSNLLRGFMFVHLKGDLNVDPIDWIDCLDPYDPREDVQPLWRRDRYTRYGIAKDVQQLLSALRTDLDSFSEAEAYALMTSGYRMTEFQFKQERCVEDFFEPEQNEPWKFLEIEDFMRDSGKGNKYLKKLLSAGSSSAFKVWKFDPLLKNLLRVSLVLIAVAIVALVYSWWTTPLPETIAQRVTDLSTSSATAIRGLTLQQVVTYIYSLVVMMVVLALLARVLTALFGTFVSEYAIKLVRWKDFVRRLALGIIISTVGFIAAVLHLYLFDKRFLSLSTLEKVKEKNG